MKVVILLSTLILSLSISSKEFNCFSKHIKEAILKNKERKKVYSKMTNGESEKLSSFLINTERITYLVAKTYDWRARKFQKNDLPILCLDYIDMDLTPSLSQDLNVPDREYRDIEKIDTSKVKEILRASLKISFYDLQRVTENLIHKNFNSGHYNCMFIHVLESIRRSASLAPHYIEAAEKREVSSPYNLIIKNIKLQINSLGLWYLMDKKASVFQEKGVQILCQDVPKIPLPTQQEIDSIYR